MCSARVIVTVLDGVGCGELPDADRFGDSGSNTLANLARAVGGLNLPNLAHLGLGNIVPMAGVPPEGNPQACFGRMAERSGGKDSTNGHWEIAGVITDGLPVFPDGLPREFIERFEASIGRGTIGNIAASGTEIVERLGREHIRTGCPIVYTSADSVFQIACHEDVIPRPDLYRICEAARLLLAGPYRVGRVIARPFTGKPGAFRRTAGRRDFSCPPPQPTLLDNVKAAGLPSVGIGKVDDLFAGQGLTESHHSVNNAECIHALLDTLSQPPAGLVFANLVQFDMDWGHRNDVTRFAGGLADFDDSVPDILAGLRPDDLLFITADHGCDPTTPSTDHSREYVPLLVCVPPSSLRPFPSPPFSTGLDLGTRATFADLGQTAAEYLGVPPVPDGQSFLSLIHA